MREVSYDPERDLLTVDGVRFSADFLVRFLKPGEGRVLTIYRKGDEILCVDGAHPPARILQFSHPLSAGVS